MAMNLIELMIYAIWQVSTGILTRRSKPVLSEMFLWSLKPRQHWFGSRPCLLTRHWSETSPLPTRFDQKYLGFFLGFWGDPFIQGEELPQTFPNPRHTWRLCRAGSHTSCLWSWCVWARNLHDTGTNTTFFKQWWSYSYSSYRHMENPPFESMYVLLSPWGLSNQKRLWPASSYFKTWPQLHDIWSSK